MDSNTPMVMKETKRRIQVDYEGKLSLKERLQYKLKASNTWIRAAINVVRFLLMLGISYVILYPFLARIASSFMTKEDLVDATVALIPKNFTLDIYKYIILENNYLGALFTTATISLLSALVQTFIACMIGYGLSKFKFKGNTAVLLAVVVTMIIPPKVLEVALSLHFQNFDLARLLVLDYKGIIELIFGKTLNLTDTYWPFLIISFCGFAFKNGLYIYMMRQFFKGVPDELEESAYVDGSGVFRTFFQIILPLSVPMMITIFLFSFSWQWTDRFYVDQFLPDAEEQIQTMFELYSQIPETLSDPNFPGWTLYKNAIQNTSSLLIILPLVIIYLFCQKYLVQGIERSGLVG